MEATIRQKLTEALAPTRLEVINESHLHAGHAGDNGTGDSHFRILLASPSFAGISRIEAQRKIYHILAEELKSGVHALSIKTLVE
jgi:BolA protein